MAATPTQSNDWALKGEEKSTHWCMNEAEALIDAHFSRVPLLNRRPYNTEMHASTANNPKGSSFNNLSYIVKSITVFFFILLLLVLLLVRHRRLKEQQRRLQEYMATPKSLVIDQHGFRVTNPEINNLNVRVRGR